MDYKDNSRIMKYIGKFVKYEAKEVLYFLIYTILLTLFFVVILSSCFWISGGIDQISQNLKYIYFLSALYASYRIVLVVISKFINVTSIYTKISHKFNNKFLVEVILFADFIATFIAFLLLIKLFTSIFEIEAESEYDIRNIMIGIYTLPIVTYISYRIIGISKIKFLKGDLTHGR